MPRTPPSARVALGTLALTLVASAGDVSAAYFAPRKTLPEGWDAKLELGAQATRGASRTESFTGASEATYRGGRAELLLVAKALQSSASVAVKRRDADGEVVRDAEGEPVTDLVRERTNDRRFLSVQPRWFFRAEKNYLFAIVDYESNEPADIDRSMRQIGGIGYRLWTDKSNYLTAGVGVGRKSLERVSGESDVGGIGYVGLSFVRRIGLRTKFEAVLDSDFGGENRFTELELGLSWKVRKPVALKIGYEARMNSDISDPENPFDESVDARATFSVEIDVL